MFKLILLIILLLQIKTSYSAEEYNTIHFYNNEITKKELINLNDCRYFWKKRGVYYMISENKYGEKNYYWKKTIVNNIKEEYYFYNEYVYTKGKQIKDTLHDSEHKYFEICRKKTN